MSPKDIKTFLLINAFFPGVSGVSADQPEITAHPQNVTKPEGQNVTLTCNAIGKPSQSISWTKYGSVISTSGDSRISFGAGNKELTITNVSRADDGEYRCVASNDLGNATSNAATMDVQCMFIVVLMFI